MDNYNDFIGKKVKVIVAFATSYSSVGASPNAFCGILQNISDDSIILSDVTKEIINGFKKEIVNVNNILINKKYLILIEEI
jgi:hypothetical protein